MKRLTSFIIAFFVLCAIGGEGTSYASDRGNTTLQSFNKAKKIVLDEVYYDHLVTFYCDCPFTPDKKIIPSGKYTPKNNGARAKRVEWEHIVPVHAFGQSFPEWRDGSKGCVDRKGKPFKGRYCASKMAVTFRYMESDLYNLVPAVGAVNGLRSNYSFGMIPGEKREFGNCDMEIENRKAEPPPEKRGDIARAYAYMDWAYPGRGIISDTDKKLFQGWDKEDPVDNWECERSKRIEKI